MADDIRTSHNPSEHRYEIWVGDDLAGVIDYRERDGVLDLYHTGVAEQFGGRGLGTRLAEFALSEVKEAGRQVIPSCPFIARFIDQHPAFVEVKS